jgi:signal transduction histidine kinase
VDDPGQHFGLVQMRELAQELGGDISIRSQPGAGTRVEALIPVKAVPTDTAPRDTGTG